jgi:hypothetical protein
MGISKYEMKCSDIFCEMALPSSAMHSQVYYHGTNSLAAAESIMQNGLQGVETQSRGHLAPVRGKVYITATLSYAIIYAIGGNYSHAMQESRSNDPYGYVFVVRGSDLQDIQPDEDSVGEFLSTNSQPIQIPWVTNGKPALKPDGTPYMRTTSWKCAIPSDDRMGIRIYWYIQNAVTPQQYKKIMDGEYSAWAAGGKRALKQMPDDMKIELINRGAHIAHHGSIRPSECWRMQKNRVSELKRDGSNFFQIAEKIVE